MSLMGRLDESGRKHGEKDPGEPGIRRHMPRAAARQSGQSNTRPDEKRVSGEPRPGDWDQGRSSSSGSIIEITSEDLEASPLLPELSDGLTADEAKDAAQWIKVRAYCQKSGAPFSVWFRPVAHRKGILSFIELLLGLEETPVAEFEVVRTELIAPGQDHEAGGTEMHELPVVFRGGSFRCPACGVHNFFKCPRCSVIVCSRGGQGTWFRCPKCGNEGYISGYIKSLDAQGKGKK